MMPNLAYAPPVAPRAAGSNSLNQGARKRSSEALFLRLPFLAGVMGAPSGARLLFGRSVSPVASATLSRLTAVGGGSQLKEHPTMSQDQTPLLPSRLLPVEFHGATLTLADFNGEPYVAMRSLVEAMGLDWTTQRQKIKARYGAVGGISPSTGSDGSVVREIMTTGSDGKSYRMTCLPLRKLAGWLMTIHPNKVRPDLRERIIAYQNTCDDVLWSHWTQGQAARATVHLPTEPAPVPPTDPLADPKVRAAINRRAHTISLRHYERLVADLTETVRLHLAKFPNDADLVRYIEQVDTPACDLVMVHRSDLWQVCSASAAMTALHQHVMERIHGLEEASGREWYGRAMGEAK